MLTDSFFSPASIAVVGASSNPKKLGHIVCKNLIDDGFSGELFPINPKGGELLGKIVYTSLQEMTILPELVIIAVPAKLCEQIVEECAALNIKNIVMFTAGFREIGEEGVAMEEHIKNACIKNDIALLGPNCLGFVATKAKVNATFAQASMKPGSLRIVSQSGALVSAFFDRSERSGVGVEHCITVGNKAILGENELLAYWSSSQTQGPIGMYLESIVDGKVFREQCSKAARKNPVFLLKPGKSQAAQQAMQSHTGSIAGDDRLLTALCTQSGVIRCDSIEDFLDISMITSWSQAPKGKKVALITNAGGPGVISTDHLETYGLEAAQFCSQIEQALHDVLPQAASVHDPIDVLGDALADRYEQALHVVCEDTAEVDAILVILTPQLMTEVEKTALIVSELTKRYEIPIICSFIGHNQVNEGIEILHNHNVPAFLFPERAIKALANYAHRYEWKEHYTPVPTLSCTKTTIPSGYINEQVSEAICQNHNIATPKVIELSSVEQCKDYSSFPAVMKLGGVPHKTEYTGVITNITTQTELVEAWDHFQEILPKVGKQATVRLQQQISGGVECILGYKYDESFGDVLLFGAGGTMTELFHDHQIKLLPVSDKEIRAVIEQSSVRPLLSGRRGSNPLAVDTLVETIKNFITLVQSHTLASCEINPLIVTQDNVYAVDVKMTGK